jgi:NTP pyrophosphatase (non-canonical NTP hydrolase)
MGDAYHELSGRILGIQGDIFDEVMSAIEKHPSYNSAHEGYAVLLEEVDELWEEVRKRQKDKARMRAEAIQVAAVAIRFVLHVCDDSRDDDGLVSSVLHKELRNALDLPDDTDWPECMIRVYRLMGGRDDTDTDTDTVTVPCQNGPNAPAEATCDGCPLLIEGGDCWAEVSDV